jgi:hypothetical protein
LECWGPCAVCSGALRAWLPSGLRGVVLLHTCNTARQAALVHTTVLPRLLLLQPAPCSRRVITRQARCRVMQSAGRRQRPRAGRSLLLAANAWLVKRVACCCDEERVGAATSKDAHEGPRKGRRPLQENLRRPLNLGGAGCSSLPARWRSGGLAQTAQVTPVNRAPLPKAHTTANANHAQGAGTPLLRCECGLFLTLEHQHKTLGTRGVGAGWRSCVRRATTGRSPAGAPHDAHHARAQTFWTRLAGSGWQRSSTGLSDRRAGARCAVGPRGREIWVKPCSLLDRRHGPLWRRQAPVLAGPAARAPRAIRATNPGSASSRPQSYELKRARALLSFGSRPQPWNRGRDAGAPDTYTHARTECAAYVPRLKHESHWLCPSRGSGMQLHDRQQWACGPGWK